MSFLESIVKRFQSPTRVVGMPELARQADEIYAKYGSRPYNPDILAAKKGGLRIYYEMRQDDQVKACLHLKKSAVTMPGYNIENDDEELKEFGEAVFDQIEGTAEDFIVSMLSGFDYGFSLHEKVYRILESGPFKGKIGLQALRPKSPTRIEFEADDFGRLKPDGIIQKLNDGRRIRLPVDKFVLFSYQKEFDNYYGESDLRAAYRSWFLKLNCQKYWGIYLERFAIPIAVGKMEMGALSKEQKDEFREIVKNIQAGMSALLPMGMEMEFLEPGRVDRGVFNQAIDACNIAIARAVLIPQLLGVVSQEGVGSYGQSKTHSETFSYILGGVSRMVEEVINEQILRPLTVMNYGERDEFPRFKFNPLSDSEKAFLAEVWTKAVTTGAVTSTVETEKHMRRLLRFPEVNEDEESQLERDRELDEKAKELKATPQPKPLPGKRSYAEDGIEWAKYVQELDGLEDEARVALTDSFEQSIAAMMKDAKKNS